MKRRILSILGSAVLLCGIVAGSVTNVSASGKELKQVDGSYLTTEEKSIGYTSSPDLRGVHLMDGESIISKAGISRRSISIPTTAKTLSVLRTAMHRHLAPGRVCVVYPACLLLR